MKKTNKAAIETDMRDEYDFSAMAGGIRGKHVKQFRQGVTLVLLEPDVARAFPTATTVNDALRKAIPRPKASSGTTTLAKPSRTSKIEHTANDRR